MADTLTDPGLARARIATIHKAVKGLSIGTGGDPAEAVFELLCVAVLIIEEARPMKRPSELIKEMRCRHG